MSWDNSLSPDGFGFYVSRSLSCLETAPFMKRSPESIRFRATGRRPGSSRRSGAAHHRHQKLDRLRFREALSADEGLPGREIEAVRDSRKERLSATASPLPASREHVSHFVPLREVRGVQRGKRRYPREVAHDDQDGVADAAVVRVELSERGSKAPL